MFSTNHALEQIAFKVIADLIEFGAREDAVMIYIFSELQKARFYLFPFHIAEESTKVVTMDGPTGLFPAKVSRCTKKQFVPELRRCLFAILWVLERPLIFRCCRSILYAPGADPLHIILCPKRTDIDIFTDLFAYGAECLPLLNSSCGKRIRMIFKMW